MITVELSVIKDDEGEMDTALMTMTFDDGHVTITTFGSDTSGSLEISDVEDTINMRVNTTGDQFDVIDEYMDNHYDYRRKYH